MRAQVIRSFGEADVFEGATLPDPEAGQGEVLVRIAASSVNPVDTKIRRAGPARAPSLPAVLGCDFAGTIVSVGPGVSGFRVGDAVYGCAGGVRGMPGTYAELIAADARLVARKPDGLSMREAAALPLVTITAWEGLDRAALSDGQTLVVFGGAGGVGHVAIQLGKARGARVVAVVSSLDKAEIARACGADETVDYRRDDVGAALARLTDRGADVVFDATGGPGIGAAFAAARLNGQVVTIVAAFEADLTPMHEKGLSLHAVFMLIPMLHDIGRARHGEILAAAATLAEAGKLRPKLDPRRFALAQVADAHRHLESGEAIGKIVIDATDPG